VRSAREGAPRAMQSIEVPGSARPDLGLGGIRRCAVEVGPELTIDGRRTVFEIFQASATRYPDRPCLGRRPLAADGTAGPYEWITYKEALDRAVRFGSGLVHFNICSANSDGLVTLGFYAKNRPEYIVGDIGCYSQKIVPVPLYDTLGAEAVEYCVRQTEMRAILCTLEVLDNVLEVAAKGLLSNVILMDGDSLSEADLAARRAAAEQAGCTLYTMGQLDAAGRANPAPFNLPSGQDIAFFCYTSGTTGDPKGAMIRHSGLISCLTGLRPYGVDMYPTDVHLSYLPLPHVFERGMMLSVLYGGGAVGFYQGDTLKILEDIQALRPTIFPSVPRLLNRVYDKLIAGVNEAGGVKSWLFHRALNAKIAGLREGRRTHPVWDRLVFNAVKAKIGFDRVRFVTTGSAPIAGHVLDFLRAVFGCMVSEGYGQTESSMLISSTLPDDYSVGHVGVPAPCNEVRLVDVPEMNYLCTDSVHSDGTPCLGRGEIWFRGPNVFAGYYKMDDKTAETVDEEGWCKTGDIGLWTADGKLRIIDRKKNIFKLAQGEYIAVEKVENVLARSPLVLQTFVYGDSLQNSLVAIVVPDPEALEARGLKAEDPKTRDEIFKSITKEARAAELKGFEIPKAIHIETVPFDQERPAADGLPERPRLLTPTFKLQRPKARDFYKVETSIVDELYEQINSRAKL